MNEKIKEIAKRAGFVCDEECNFNSDVIDWSSSYDNELEKFAHLIIKECLHVIRRKMPGDGPTPENLRSLEHCKDLRMLTVPIKTTHT